MSNKRSPMPSIEGLVEDLSHDGNGIIKIEGKVYFVPGVLPGERVSFLPKKKRRGKFEGVVESIITASSKRITPECEYFERCGGCSFQHLKPDSQLRNKEKILFDNLQRLGRVEAMSRFEPIQSGLWKYRRKARPGIRFVPKKGGIMVGFREPGSSYITSLQHCKALDSRISVLLPSLHELIEKLSHNDRIPQIEVAAADNAVALVLRHLESLDEQDKALIKDYAKRHQLQFYSQSGGLNTITPIWPNVPEKLYYELKNFGLMMEFGPVDFIQVNGEVNQLMIEQAVSSLELEDGDRVLDMFCGLGNFTLPIATKGVEVLGIEGDDELVKKGQSNAMLNQLPNAQFAKANLHASDLENVLDHTVIQTSGINKMLIDPPRSGALEVIKQLIPKLRPDILVYVSCNPATLGRDAEVMVHVNGYVLDKAGVIDMFPHTAHVESMAVFRRVKKWQFFVG